MRLLVRVSVWAIALSLLFTAGRRVLDTPTLSHPDPNHLRRSGRVTEVLIRVKVRAIATEDAR